MDLSLVWGEGMSVKGKVNGQGCLILSNPGGSHCSGDQLKVWCWTRISKSTRLQIDRENKDGLCFVFIRTRCHVVCMCQSLYHLRLKNISNTMRVIYKPTTFLRLFVFK